MRRVILSIIAVFSFGWFFAMSGQQAQAVFCVSVDTPEETPVEYADSCPARYVETTAALESCDVGQDVLGIPTWYKYLKGEQIAGKCRPVVNASADALPIGLAVFEAAITIAGLVAVAYIFVGSFQYVLTQGEPDKATNARKTVINAVIGLVIVIIATRVVSFIAKRLTS